MEAILVGNKCDLNDQERQVSYQEGLALAEKLKIPFMETSALNGTNVESSFVSMTQAIKKSVDRRGLTGVKAGSMTKAGGVVLSTKERNMSLSEKCGCRF